MTLRHPVTRWLGALGLMLSLVGLVCQGATSAQTPLSETQRRAEEGDVTAQYNLGVRYVSGRGVPQDDTQAMAWYRKAADQGHAGAQYDVGIMYVDGRGVPQDDAQAAAWWRKAADQGFAAAQTNLGAMYSAGQGVPQDYVEALKWRSIAASRVTGDEQEEYAQTRDAVAKQMTPAQLAEAQTRAADWQAAFEKRQID